MNTTPLKMFDNLVVLGPRKGNFLFFFEQVRLINIVIGDVIAIEKKERML